jgi:hypothetical protein
MLYFTLLIIVLLIAVLTDKKRGGVELDGIVYADTTRLNQLTDERSIQHK